MLVSLGLIALCRPPGGLPWLFGVRTKAVQADESFMMQGAIPLIFMSTTLVTLVMRL